MTRFKDTDSSEYRCRSNSNFAEYNTIPPMIGSQKDEKKRTAHFGESDDLERDF